MHPLKIKYTSRVCNKHTPFYTEICSAETKHWRIPSKPSVPTKSAQPNKHTKPTTHVQLPQNETKKKKIRVLLSWLTDWLSWASSWGTSLELMLSQLSRHSPHLTSLSFGSLTHCQLLRLFSIPLGTCEGVITVCCTVGTLQRWFWRLWGSAWWSDDCSWRSGWYLNCLKLALLCLCPLVLQGQPTQSERGTNCVSWMHAV